MNLFSWMAPLFAAWSRRRRRSDARWAGADLGPTIRRAVVMFGGQSDGTFNTAAFQQSVRADFGLDDLPDSRSCAAVLDRVPVVERLPGGCHWKCRDLWPVAGTARATEALVRAGLERGREFAGPGAEG